MRFLISGATGFIGSELLTQALAAGHEVRALDRSVITGPVNTGPDAAPHPDLVTEVSWADVVVNLAGAPLTRLPWTKSYRAEIVRSRARVTTAIVQAILASPTPPQALLSGSAVGYYGSRPGEILTEKSSADTGFLAMTVRIWEAAARKAAPATRVVLLRTGMVLGPAGGALAPLQLTTRLGLGTVIGSGSQFWPWISLEDEVRAILHLAEAEVSGPVNLAAPNPATAAEVAEELARQLRRPQLLRVPQWAARTALGEAADELLLASQLMVPRVLLDSGFRFTHPQLAQAIAAALPQ